MELTIKIDMDTPQAKQFVQFVRTLPFVKIEGKWNQAIADGGMTPEEFVEKVKARYKERFGSQKRERRTNISEHRAENR